MSTETLTTPSAPVSNGLALSEMIQTSARAESSWVPLDNPTVFSIRFRHPRHARAFQHAFESFEHAAKRTVKRVRAKERAEMAMKSPGKITI
jgi:hypothetical protein